MKGSEFVFDYVQLLYYKCHKINPNRGGFYVGGLDWIYRPDWVKNKQTINLIIKKDNKWFK